MTYKLLILITIFLTVHVIFQIIKLEWWPLTRDCSLYIVTVGVLTAVTFDEKIEWYEALILILMYITYFLIMWGNGHLMKLAKKLEVKIIGSKTVLNDPGKLVFRYFVIKSYKCLFAE
jgi:Ca2+/Na+ antiporter